MQGRWRPDPVRAGDGGARFRRRPWSGWPTATGSSSSTRRAGGATRESGGVASACSPCSRTPRASTSGTCGSPPRASASEPTSPSAGSARMSARSSGWGSHREATFCRARRPGRGTRGTSSSPRASRTGVATTTLARDCSSRSPIRRGRMIGFGARRLHDGDPIEAKYVNTPETELFQKGAVVYGLHLARPAIAKQDEAVVVEGYTDVIALHQAGLGTAVASMGTALTAQQLRELRRLCSRLFLCFDADKAGQEATLRGMELAYREFAEVRVIALPKGSDPADAADGFAELPPGRRVLSAPSSAARDRAGSEQGGGVPARAGDRRRLRPQHGGDRRRRVRRRPARPPPRPPGRAHAARLTGDGRGLAKDPRGRRFNSSEARSPAASPIPGSCARSPRSRPTTSCWSCTGGCARRSSGRTDATRSWPASRQSSMRSQRKRGSTSEPDGSSSCACASATSARQIASADLEHTKELQVALERIHQALGELG